MIGYHQPDLSTSRKSISVKLIIDCVIRQSCIYHACVIGEYTLCAYAVVKNIAELIVVFYEKCNRWLVRVSSFVIVWTKKGTKFRVVQFYL